MDAPLANATVEPVAAPAAQPQAPAPGQLPSPLADVAQGVIPAVSLAPIEGDKLDPLQQFTVEHFKDLPAAGLDYLDLSGNHSVLFNPKSITAEELEAADKAGKLFEIAPLSRELGVPPGSSPAPTGGTAPAAPAGPAAGAPAGGALSGMAVQDPGMQAARLKNLAPAPKAAPNPVPGVLAKRAV